MYKKLYLDVCTLCRPFDDQNVLRIRLETDAVYLILNGAHKKQYQIIASPVHYLEIESIPEMNERIEVLSILKQYAVKLTNYDSNSIRSRSEYFYTKKLGVADAVHVAFAEKSSEIFITCDDRLLKQCRKLKLKIKVLNPVEFTILENLQ